MGLLGKGVVTIFVVFLCLSFASSATGEYYKIVVKHSGKCLDIRGASTEDWANVIQYGWHGGDNQLFKLVPATDEPGYYWIFAKHSGKCLDVEGASTENWANPTHGSSGAIDTGYGVRCAMRCGKARGG